MQKTILVVEDDNDLRTYLENLLNDNGYSILSSDNGLKALQLLEKQDLDLILLDLGLPQVSGESVLGEIRKKRPDMPVVILTAKDQVADILRGYNLGADDYITKPFEGDLLLARIKARLRHLGEDSTKLKVADLELNNKTFVVTRKGKVISLSRKEFNLLQYLMTNKGRVLTRDMILQRIWLSADYVEPRVVDIYIGYIRKKIDNKFSKKLVHTVRGFGYMIKE